jgi:hypothetical protein
MKAGTLGSVCFSFHHHSGTERVLGMAFFFLAIYVGCVYPHMRKDVQYVVYTNRYWINSVHYKDLSKR